MILENCRCRDASKTPIFWDTDITALEGDEIRVEVKVSSSQFLDQNHSGEKSSKSQSVDQDDKTGFLR